VVEEEVLIEVYLLVILQEPLVVQVVEADNVNLVVQVTLLQQVPHKEILVELLHLLLVVEVEVQVVLAFQETQLVIKQKQAQALLYNLIYLLLVEQQLLQLQQEQCL